jgi:hypothetical protein
VRGILVGNASRQLFAAAMGSNRAFVSTQANAAGVLAGLRHFGAFQPADAVIGSGAR